MEDQSLSVPPGGEILHAPHSFVRNKKMGKNVKCAVCGAVIWTSGYNCTICEMPVHKACAVKIRTENCPLLEKELSLALSSNDSPNVFKLGTSPSEPSSVPSLSASSPSHAPSSPALSTSFNSTSLEIFLSDGSSKNIVYQPEVTLSTVLAQIREERDLEGNCVIYDKTGKIVTNYDQTLKRIKYTFPLFLTAPDNNLKAGKKSRLRLSGKKKKPNPASLPSPPDLKSSNHTSSPQLAKNRKSLLQKQKLPKKIPKHIDEEAMEQLRHGTMTITVLSVSDLANQTSAYKLLYFTLTNLDNQSQRHRSKLLENTANPTWNQSIKFHMPCAYGQWNIKIWATRKVMDYNTTADVLGEADFILKGFKDGDSELKTLILKTEDHHKKDKKGKRIQLDSLHLENQQLRVEIEEEKRQKEVLKLKLEEAQKQITLQHDVHTEEIKSIKTKIQQQNNGSKASSETLMSVLEEQIDSLKQELNYTRTTLQQVRAREETLKKNYEEQLEYYKNQAEGGKKNPKIQIQWTYQDRKLKTSIANLVAQNGASTASSVGSQMEVSKRKMEWTPSKHYEKSLKTEVVSSKGAFLLRARHQDDEESQRNKDGTAAAVSLDNPPALHKKKRRIQDVYDLGEVLGTGGSSVVREGSHKETGQKVAIKILDNYDNVEDASDEEEAFWAEIEIIKQLDHPCVLNVYDFYEDSEHYYVVLELLSGNELFDQIIEKGCYEEPEAVSIVYQVLLALDHLAAKSICHLDLKPENILFTDETHTRIKLIDFGEASSCKDHKLTGWVGTNNYMAPEMIKHLEYDCKVDMWSLGVVTYIMLCGSFAFDADDEIELYQDIMDMRYEFRSPEWDTVSEEAKNFVISLLTGPLERLSAGEALKHPWIMLNLPYVPPHVRALGEL